VKNFRSILLVISALIFASLACGSVAVGIVTPTTNDVLVNSVDTQEPTPEMSTSVPSEELSQPTQEPTEDFSDLWIEYWDPKYGYGIALPSHWQVSPTPMEGYGGAMITKSFDEEFFLANSIKGNWIGGQAPEGAVKLDFVGMEGVVPEKSLEVAISDLLGSDPETSVVLSTEVKTIGSQEAVLVTTARPPNMDDTTTSIAFRLSPETILLVAAYPNSALFSDDVQTILSTLVLDKSTPITKPTNAPHPPLTVHNQPSGMATATTAIAWYGHIASNPEGEPYEDKVVLFPSGIGEFGVKGNTPELEEKIQSVRDASGEAEFVHLWGVLYCNIDDYNNCQLNVERLEYGDQYTVAISPVEQWVGKIKSMSFNGTTAFVFELSGAVPVWYGLSAGDDQLIQEQIESLANSDTIVNLWGDLLVGVDDVNGTRITVQRMDPPSPGDLPSSAACDSGYMGVLEETIDLITYNLEIGNYYPLSYTIGNPFVIGYWRSEGVTMPREEAYQQLTENYLPSPDDVVIITDPDQFPDLDGMPLESMWGPEVDVAANLYSKGWGPEGQDEAMIVIARCSQNGQEGYFWYGMLYAMGGFE